MENNKKELVKNKIFKVRKLVYFSVYILLISCLIVLPYQAKASFFSEVLDKIIKLGHLKNKDFLQINTSAVLNSDSDNLLSIIESDPKQVLKKTPLSKRVTLTGTLEVIHQDDFKQNKSKNLYFLKDNAGKKISLYFGKGEPGFSKSGSKIRIKQGARVGNKMAVESVDGKYFQVTAKPTTESVTGTKKIAVILFNFSNDTSQPSTVDYLRKLIFTGKHDESQDSANEFYQENSFEKTKFEGYNRTDGDFYGWYTIDNTNADCSSEASSWKDNAAKLAQKDGYDSKNYYSTIYFIPSTSCGWAGIATGNSDSGRWSIINGARLDVVAHEIGHNLGLNHASSYYCTDSSGGQVSISSDCTASEYGDIYDVMGYAHSDSVGHVNTASKGKLEWYSNQNKSEITKDGVYDLYPLEYSSSGTQSLRIARKDSSGVLDGYYYIEYRQLSKYDKTKGVFIRIGSDYENFYNTYLIDSDISSDNYSLSTDKTFYDSLFGIEITTTEISSSVAKVQVKFKKTDECVNANPSITVSPESYTGRGEKATYKVKITNNNKNCSATSYKYSTTASNQWGYAFSDTSGSIPAQSSKTTTFTLEPPADVKEGKYDFTIKISNSLDESYSNSVTGYYIIDYSSTALSSSSSSKNSSSNSSSSNLSSSSSQSSSSKSRSSSSSLTTANHTVVTNSATNITSTSATLNGVVNPKGESVYYQFKYRKESESPELTKKTSPVNVDSDASNVSVSSTISDLSPGTKYVYRLYAYNNTTNEEVSGSLKLFKTSKSSFSSSSRSSSSRSRSSSSRSFSNSSGESRSSSSSVLPIIYTLTVSEVGTGLGSVLAPGIKCPLDCVENYSAGTNLNLVAIPATGFVFGGWTGCNISNGTSCIVRMDSSKSIIVNFVKL